MKKLIWVLGFLGVFAGASLAGTADGLTPAEETVCEEAGLSGAAWGLCNAYCEAMDCDSASPKASVEACTKTAEQFAEKTSGYIPPCEQVTAPDTDGDTVLDDVDNCLYDINPDQSDIDNNGIGDVCDCPCWSSADSLYQRILLALNASYNTFIGGECIHHEASSAFEESDIIYLYSDVDPEILPIFIFALRYDPMGCAEVGVPPNGGPDIILALESFTQSQRAACAAVINNVCTELGYW